MASPSLIGWVFALSPFPAYLPQYFSLMRQLAVIDYGENEDNDRSTANSTSLLRSHSSESVSIEEQLLGRTIDRGLDSLRKRNHHHDYSPPSAAPHSGPVHIPPGSPSKSPHSERCDIHNGSSSNNTTVAHGVGLSRATVFLLLSAHLLRIFYFYGLKLENERMLSSAAVTKVLDIQWDLVGQSICMIIMQLLLLWAMTKMRKKLNSRKTISDCSTTTHTDGSWQLLAITKAHFRRLLSPYNILTNHSFLEYLELILLSSLATKLIFEYHFYPRYHMRVIDTLKNTSIALESCLAVPQAIRNYSKGNTDGLNAIMVGGWLIGDILKLSYFSLNMLWSRITGVGDAAGNIVFVFGCVFALAVDFLVCFQLAFWYPSREAIELKEGLSLSIQKMRTSGSLECCKLLLRCEKRTSNP
ncbi:hypothetical protein ACHAWC_005715 [Mediolabrus comicus]